MGAGLNRTERRRRRGSGRRPMSEINVTPFVDVMLVLLVIFMVAAPLVQTGVPVELPPSAADALPQAQEPPLEVALDAAGRVFIGENEVPLDALATALSGVDPAQEVALRADAALPYGAVARVMGALEAAGLRKIAFVHVPDPVR